MANSGYKNICRMEQAGKGLYGWYGRINFRGKSYSKFFSDKKYNGKDDALVAAVVWRDEKCTELGKPITTRRVVSTHPKNKTGVIGIRRYKKQTGKNKAGRPYFSDVYEVTWSPEPNKVKRTSFSVLKWGEEGAYNKALELRREHERKAYGSELRWVDSAE